MYELPDYLLLVCGLESTLENGVVQTTRLLAIGLRLEMEIEKEGCSYYRLTTSNQTTDLLGCTWFQERARRTMRRRILFQSTLSQPELRGSIIAALAIYFKVASFAKLACAAAQEAML